MERPYDDCLDLAIYTITVIRMDLYLEGKWQIWTSGAVLSLEQAFHHPIVLEKLDQITQKYRKIFGISYGMKQNSPTLLSGAPGCS